MLKGKADACEIFFSSQEGFTVEVKDRKVDSSTVSSSQGVGLRVIKGKRLGFSFSSDLSPESLKRAVEDALMGAQGVSVDELLGFPPPHEIISGDLGLYDPTLFDVQANIEKALTMEDVALGFDPRVKKIQKAIYQTSSLHARIINSSGVDLSQAFTFVTASLTAIAEDGGDAQMGWDMELSHISNEVDVVKVGRMAARRAVDMLGARVVKGGRYPAVLENTVAVEFLETLAPSFLADNLHKGKSMLRGKKGQRIFSQAIDIWDNGLLPKGWGTSYFDGEGVPRQKTPLVVEGVCQGYLYDTYWARRGGMLSTGNSSRTGFKVIPGVSVSNMHIEKGEVGLEDLIGGIKKGLFITGLLGVNTANTVTGEFSFGATGFWIEGGKVAYPVRGVAIAGDLIGLFSKVDRVGSDIRFLGRVGAPSLYLREIEISGGDPGKKAVNAK
ncbi:MAG: TldD/PmbA family protein [Deltaproteobacteria bacterium]|nr:TldD/PmbA family protein [Deltaproteobacteria bacterium]